MSTDILVNDILPKLQYVATQGQTQFSYTFPIIEATDLAIYRTPAGQAPNDFSQKLTFDSDYTVENVGGQAGGNITMLIAINAGDRITIQRAMPYERLSSYSGGMRFNPESLDNDLNAIIMMMQQIHAYYEKRFVRYENTIVDDTSNLRLPVLADGQFWKRNSGGIAAVTLEENPDWSTLRSELANQDEGTDGAKLIGYHDPVIGNTTIHDAIQYHYSGTFYGVDVGVQNAIQVSLPNINSYREGMKITIKIANNNTAATTLQIDNLGVKNATLQSGDDLPISTIITGMMAEFIYDGTKFIIINPFESNSDFRTGDVKITSRADAEPGWVIMNDGTIGSASSSATTLKSNICKDLFIHLWGTYDNTIAPVVEGRGANAEADWLANKQIKLLSVAGRALAAAGQGSGLIARANGFYFGEEGHILTQSELASHAHGSTSGTNFIARNTAARSIEGSDAGAGEFPPIYDTGSNLTANVGNNLPHNTIQPTVWLSVFIKL